MFHKDQLQVIQIQYGPKKTPINKNWHYIIRNKNLKAQQLFDGGSEKCKTDRVKNVILFSWALSLALFSMNS